MAKYRMREDCIFICSLFMSFNAFSCTKTYMYNIYRRTNRLQYSYIKKITKVKDIKSEKEREGEKRKRKTFMKIANVKSVFRQKLIKNRTQLSRETPEITTTRITAQATNSMATETEISAQREKERGRV